MRKYFCFAPTPVCQEQCVLTLGMFDGVHQGHQYLLKRAKEVAFKQNALFVVLTFRELPKAQNNLIITSYHKNVLLEQLGVDILVELAFSEGIKNLHPKQFLDLVETMFPVSTWVVGEDLRFGADRLGDPAFLSQLTQGRVEVVEQYFREEFSSTNVRRNISQGNLSKASFLLGRTYSLMGKAHVFDSAPFLQEESDGGFQLPPLTSTKTSLTLDAKDLCLPQLGSWHALVRLGEEYHDLPAACSISSEKSCFLTLHDKLPLPPTLFPEVILLSKIEKL